MAEADRALTETLGRFGLDSLTSQPNLCRNTLRDKLPDRPREVALLVTALEAGVPTRLRTDSRISDVDTVAAQLAGRLEHSYGLSSESARWAVQTWAAALDLASTATPPPSPAAVGANSREVATVIRTPSDDVTAPPIPSDDVTAPPIPSDDVTAPPIPSEVASSPAPSGEGTVLRTAPGAGTAPSPPPITATPRKKGAGWGGRRLVGIVGVVALIGIIVGVAVVGFGGSGGGPHRTTGQSKARQPVANRSISSSASAASASASASSTSSASTRAFASISPVLAHRGDHEGYPEETLPAFLQAANRGFTVETDVRWTKDGVPIINHNTTTGLGMVCSGGPYVVSKTRWAVLRSRCRTSPAASKAHRAYGIPTFDTTVEQLSRIPGATLFAEIKIDQTPAENKEYLAILRKWHMVSRTVATSFVSAYLEDFGKEVTQEGIRIRTLRFASVGGPTTLADLQHTHVWGAVFLEVWDRIPALMTSAGRVGIHVGIATTSASGDGPPQWSEAKQLGAEFVLTDRPSAYHTWLAHH